MSINKFISSLVKLEKQILICNFEKSEDRAFQDLNKQLEEDNANFVKQVYKKRKNYLKNNLNISK